MIASAMASQRHPTPSTGARAPRSAGRIRPRSRAQRGVTLLELLIGVGVIIVIMVVVLMGMRGLNAQMDRTALLRQVPQIKLNLAGLGGDDPGSFETLDTAAAVKLGAFPKDTVTGSGADVSVANPFGGKIFATGLGADLLPLKKGRAFSLSYTDIPSAQCASIVRGLAMVAEGVWIDTATTQPSQAPPDTSAMIKSPGTTKPIDLVELANKCAPGGDTDKVTVHALMSISI